MQNLRFFILALLDLLLPFGKRGDRWRGVIASPLFKSCGINLKFKKNVYFASPHKVSLGKNVWFSNNVTLGAGEICIGDNVLFGPSVCVHAENHTRLNGAYRFGPSKGEPVFIGSGTWIGANATICAGAHIGTGSIVAAGTVVLRGEYPCDSLLAGVPAVVRKRLSD